MLLSEMETQFLRLPICNIVTIVTELSWFESCTILIFVSRYGFQSVT